MKNIVDNRINILDNTSVFLCQNVSDKYELGISNKNHSINHIQVKIPSIFAWVFGKLKKYILKRGIKFLLSEKIWKNIFNLLLSKLFEK